ncbi:MAG: hypothetical protein GXX79_19300 [Actinomycetales bacterium]|nr:hypothetical protein [Actinomycetales bacterium]
MSTASGSPAEEVWASYFAAVEAAALAVAEKSRQGQLQPWPDLIAPGVPFPVTLERRRVEVLAVMEGAVREARIRRDAIAQDLAALHPPRTKVTDTSGTLGSHLDMVG